MTADERRRLVTIRMVGRASRTRRLPLRCPVCWSQFMQTGRVVPAHPPCSGGKLYGRPKMRQDEA